MTAPDSPLPTTAKALRALLLAERTRHAEELAAARGEADRAQGELERLMAIIKELQRHRFGRRAERLDPEQLALALEDVEQTLAAADAAAENDATARSKPRRAGGGSIAARCRRICRVKRSSSMSRTRPAHAAAASSTGSARTSRNGSTSSRRSLR